MAASHSLRRAPPRCAARRGRRVRGLVFALTAALATAAILPAADPIASVPLAPHSGPRGATMFHAMTPEETGVVTVNSYADPKMWSERYRELELGAVGTGVAIGDYDNDGRPDIFVVSKTEGCRLFRNLGGWKFEDVTEKAGVGDHGEAAAIWKQGATFVDVNNDGLLDLYVCRFNAPNLLYINHGDGTFREEAAARGLAVKDSSVMAAFCDYDRDGWLDVFVQTNLLDGIGHPQGQRDYLFHNNGDGTFTDVTNQAGISGESQGHSASWWDFDGDGWPDLYVANDFAPPDKLYRNNHDGTFTNVIDQVVPHMPSSSMGSDFGDLNNDGLIDLFVADMAATTHEKDQRTMAATRALATDPPEPESANAPQYLRNALYVSTGTGRCLEAACLAGLAATDWTWSVRFEDLDNDGRLDLHVTNGMHRESHNTDLIARMTLAASPADKIRIERSSPVLAETHLAFRNLGDLQFENVSAAWGLDEKGVSYGAAFGDLDGDGDLDLVYTNYQKGVTLLRNDSDTGHRVIIALRGLAGPADTAAATTGARSNRFGVGAVVRLETAAGVQVRQLFLARGLLSSSEPIVHFGLGEDTLIRRLTVDWPSGRRQVFADLPVDRKFVITESVADEPRTGAGRSPPAGAALRTESAPRDEVRHPQFAEVGASANFAFVVREPKVDELAANPLQPVRLNRRGPALAVGEVRKRGVDDLVLGGTPLDPARLLLADGAGHFADGGALPGATATVDDGPVLLFDADGDGHDDVLVTRGGVARPAGSPEYQPQLFLNDGRGNFHPAPAGALPVLPLSVGAAAAADFDRSGRLGVFLGSRVLPGQYPFAPRGALLANRGGRFEDVTDRLAPALRQVGLVSAALWSDVDNDGWPDLLVALEWGPVKYFHNNQGKGFEDWTDRAGFGSAGAGWWTSLAAADFNGDGRLDYVVGNVGLNTPYHAEPAHPALLYAGDFNGDDGTELVEAYEENGRLYPWRARKDLGAQIPAVLKRYVRNDTYARATLGEILGEDRLAAAQRFAATELRSGVFLSQPDGTYRFVPLPRLAQIAPLQGLVAGDFDGDGHADIYAVENSYAPIPSVGRFDGGLSQWLRGDGHGKFFAAAPAETGLVVPGDAKALVVIDLDRDGWPDFLVSRNNGGTLAFRNQGRPGHHSIAVRLHGPAGNPAAVGARLTVEMADGSTQTGEIEAGSGYYSQSSPAWFFGWLDANRPQRLRVRWPSGASTEHVILPGVTTLDFSPDGT